MTIGQKTNSLLRRGKSYVSVASAESIQRRASAREEFA
jgi:hypothetical protein